MYKYFALLTFLVFITQNGQAQADSVPPVIVCKSVIPVHLSDFCFGYMKVQDLIDTVYDNSQYVELAFRKECTGDGFPATDSLLFLGSEFSSTVVIWARDSSGNTSTCSTTLYFLDHGFCDGGSSLWYFSPEGDGIDGVTSHIYGSNCLLDSLDYYIPAIIPGWGSWWHSWVSGNWISYSGMMPAAGYSYEVVPFRNNDPLNGVTTYDLTLISRHILGLEPLNSPYKILAADVNMDGYVTTYDIVLIRKLILGIITQLPHGKSWRFIPYDYAFPNPQNPLAFPIPDRVSVPRSSEFSYGSFHFTGLKIGDVNFTAHPD